MGFRHIKNGPIVFWFSWHGILFTWRIRRQRIGGIACSGFFDLSIGQRINFSSVGKNLFRGKHDLKGAELQFTFDNSGKIIPIAKEAL